jgi:hypothetical protein
MVRGWPGLLCGLAAVVAPAAEVRIAGKVVDDNQVAVAGARVWIEDNSVLSDPTGAFVLTLERPGEHRINAQREGFFLLRNHPLRLDPGENLVTLVLNHQREVHDSIQVTYSPPAVNPEEIKASHQIVSTEILGIPYPQTNNLRNALPMMPGVVQDSRGNLHIAGGSADQTYWSLDGFNITDPLTGRLETHVNVDGVRTVEVATSRYSAETGKGSAGAVQIRTLMGDDRWRPTGTNFFPGIENRKGLIIGNWTPRATIAGPIRRGRAWISDALDARYEQNVVEELPAGQDRNTIWRASNLLRFQVNLTPSNILTASWLANVWNARNNGLSMLDPIETTSDRSTRQQFVSLKDQLYLGRGALLELGYAALRGWARESPHGSETYIFTPEGRRGNFFLHARRRSSRDQWLANLFLPARDGPGGSHQVQAGLDLNRITYFQRAHRHPYEFYRSTLTRLRRVEFYGNPELSRRNFEASGYFQDRWKPVPYLLVEAGVRADWDQIIRHAAVSPRLSLSLAPPRLANTKFVAGFGLFRDAPNIRVLSRHLDQYTVARYYESDGVTPRLGPAAAVYLLDERLLVLPVYRNFSLGAEQLLPGGFHARFDYLRKRGRDGLTFVGIPSGNRPPPPGATQYEALFLLRNARRDVYDSFEVTVRKSFRRQSQVMASYTRSRALSNAVVDVNIDDPILVTDNEGRLPWDAPNRLINWGLVALSERNSIAWLFEWRDGYPFHVIDDEGRLQGRNTERRFPAYANLNLHWERKVSLLGHRWALRGGFNNITDRLNATVVNNNASSPNFLRFSGGQRRAFVFRMRWLGKVSETADANR